MAATSNNQIEEPLMNNSQTVLQRHVGFFDRDKNGVIYPCETFQGLRAIGLGMIISLGGAVLINMVFSGKTRPGKFPSLLFPIEVKNIAKGMHTSDSGVYDAEGNFDPVKFEEIFQKHSKTNANALTADELWGLLKANRVPKDYFSWFLSFFEWKLLYVVGKDKNGLLQREALEALFTGELFYRLEQERARK
ncbi:hypothetical protein MKX03_000258 [Papaver bracteatum]|nr:hypothetical protein MKX03_022297 [Papaver bracteatum]KAI3868347.1 hypothetical protein MKX03_000258 [Papaver bracteatum]